MTTFSVDPDSSAILLSLIIGLISMFLTWFGFEMLRWLQPRLYYYRWFLSQYDDVTDYDGKRVFCHPLPGKGFLGWIAPVLAADVDSMATTHGLDVVMFLRFMRTSAYMFGVLCVGTAALLMPIYATGQNKNLPPDHPQFVAGVNILSIANLSAGDNRLWGTLVAEFVCAIIVYIFTYNDYKKYVRFRRRYKAQRIPANFACVVAEMRSDSLNEVSVKKFFEKVVPGGVAEVHHVLNASKTQKKINEYMSQIRLLETRESARNAEQGKGKTDENAEKEIEYYRLQAEKIQREVLQEQEERDPALMPPTTSAVVLFRDIVTAAIATQDVLLFLSDRRQSGRRPRRGRSFPDGILRQSTGQSSVSRKRPGGQ